MCWAISQSSLIAVTNQPTNQPAHQPASQPTNQRTISAVAAVDVFDQEGEVCHFVRELCNPGSMTLENTHLLPFYIQNDSTWETEHFHYILIVKYDENLVALLYFKLNQRRNHFMRNVIGTSFFLSNIREFFMIFFDYSFCKRIARF